MKKTSSSSLSLVTLCTCEYHPQRLQVKGEDHEAPTAYHTDGNQNDAQRRRPLGTSPQTAACPHCSSLCSARTPSSGAQLPARAPKPRRAQKWLALGRAGQRSHSVRDATPALQCCLGCRWGT